MAEEKNKLAPRNMFAAKKVGVAAKLDAAKRDYDPDKMENRIGLIFDNSGSMGGNKIVDAKKATDAFLKVCNPANTAVAFYTFSDHLKLTTDLISINFYAQGLGTPEMTPLWSTMDKVQENENINRAVIFSDGGPTDGRKEDSRSNLILDKYVEKKIPCDTVFIGSDSDSEGQETLKYIAEKTGGIYLFFKDGETFAKNFKYLAPAFRAMLTDGNFREAIQKG